RLNVPVLYPKHPIASAAPARLHFIADKEAAVLPDDRYGFPEILLGRRDKTAHSHNWLGHEPGDFSRCRCLDKLLQVLCAGDLAFGICQLQRAAIVLTRSRGNSSG